MLAFRHKISKTFPLVFVVAMKLFAHISFSVFDFENTKWLNEAVQIARINDVLEIYLCENPQLNLANCSKKTNQSNCQFSIVNITFFNCDLVFEGKCIFSLWRRISDMSDHVCWIIILNFVFLRNSLFCLSLSNYSQFSAFVWKRWENTLQRIAHIECARKRAHYMLTGRTALFVAECIKVVSARERKS